MTTYFSLSQLSNILDITDFIKPNYPINELNVTGINTDSRTIKPGDIFITLVGEKFDGHDFVTRAIAQGAIAVICSRRLDHLNVPQFVVKNTLEAYQTIAAWWRKQLDLPIIGITGSVGKTSTKELVAAVLGTQGKVLKTQANYNNEIGVPKTLLQITPEHDYAVIEMAMRGTGEIALLTKIAQPTIGIITNVGTAHIGRLGSREAIANAKCELLAQMPESSTAILNYDNPLLIETAKKVWQGKTLTYGLTGGDLQGRIINEQIIVGEQSFPLPLPGEHNASNYLAAIATAQILNIDLATLASGVTVQLPKGRSRRYDLPNDIVVLDETYNAGLESMLAAVQMLKDTPGQRHIAVLGTMKELGEYAGELHRQVGAKVQELALDLLLILADEPTTQEMALGASQIPHECFGDRASLIRRLHQVMRPGDRILCKASNSVGLDRVVADLVGEKTS